MLATFNRRAQPAEGGKLATMCGGKKGKSPHQKEGLSGFNQRKRRDESSCGEGAACDQSSTIGRETACLFREEGPGRKLLVTKKEGDCFLLASWESENLKKGGGGGETPRRGNLTERSSTPLTGKGGCIAHHLAGKADTQGHGRYKPRKGKERMWCLQIGREKSPG